MAGRNSIPVYAAPIALKFTEKEGYLLIVKVTEGPSNLLDRKVSVRLTNQQLDAIGDWNPGEGECGFRLDLESVR